MLRTDVCWEQTAHWVSTVMRESVEVSMGDSGRDGIPREPCGGGEGEHNVSTVREGWGEHHSCHRMFCSILQGENTCQDVINTIGNHW